VVCLIVCGLGETGEGLVQWPSLSRQDKASRTGKHELPAGARTPERQRANSFGWAREPVSVLVRGRYLGRISGPVSLISAPEIATARNDIYVRQQPHTWLLFHFLFLKHGTTDN
jgi:hypothetical protein